MARDISIAFSASDRLSDSVRRMRSNVRDLSRDVSEYRRIQNEAFNERSRVRLDISQARQQLRELERLTRQGAEGSREAYQEQQASIEQLSEEYRRLGQVIRAASNEERGLQRELSRSDNANASRFGAIGGIMRSVATAGLGAMAGGAIQNYIGTSVTSMFGSSTGSLFGNVSGNAISGAAMGSIAGPIGAAVGAAVGGLTGAINSLAEKQTKQDDYYRAEVQSLHSAAISDMETKLTSGSEWAAEREMYKRNYASMTDDEAGARLYKSIMQYGDTTPYDTSVMLGKGMEMLSYGIDRESVMETMQMLGNIAMGDENKFSGLAYAVSQSMNMGYLKAQDKNQMVGWGFNPLEYVAKNEGVSLADATKMMSDGKISSDMLMDAIRLATSEGERYYDAVTAMSDTFTGMQGQLESAKKNISIAAGEAFNETRKTGMAEEIETYTGEMADKMKAAYAMIGSYEAELENQHQKSIIDAITKVYESDEYKRALADGNGLEAERLMWEAQTNAEIAYKNSEEYRKKLDAEKSLVREIQDALVAGGDYVNFGKEMADQFSIGWSGGVRQAIQDGLSGAAADAAVSGHGNVFQKFTHWANGVFSNSAAKNGELRGHATGLPRVPYDGYPAMLHEGERVLTRTEAKQMDNGFGGVHVAKLADSIIIREEADIEKIAMALARKLKAASEVYGG